MSLFSELKPAPSIELFVINERFAKDKSDKKVGLGAGIYMDINGKPYVLPVVEIAEKKLANDDTLSKDYAPTLGYESLREAAVKLLLGADNLAIKEKRAFGIQCLSGNGSLVVGAEFLRKVLGRTIYYHSDPTWGNHPLLFSKVGFTDGREYRYWSAAKRGIDFEGMIEDLKQAPEDSVIILHACAHNPTGCDPSQEQWKEIAAVVKERNLFPFFDSAYQGFASGDFVKDAWAVSYFVSQGIELFCAQSFSKNFGLYNERVGNLTIVVNNPAYADAIKSQIGVLIKGMFSSPPSHGARIVSYVLNNPELYEQWLENVKTMSQRVIEMRKRLRGILERLGTPGNWSHITSQIGMFSYTGLTANQVTHLIDNYHIYLLKSGRISMCGLSASNIEYVAKAIHDSVTNIK